jgi:hypothetical protein
MLRIGEPAGFNRAQKNGGCLHLRRIARPPLPKSAYTTAFPVIVPVPVHFYRKII